MSAGFRAPAAEALSSLGLGGVALAVPLAALGAALAVALLVGLRPSRGHAGGSSRRGCARWRHAAPPQRRSRSARACRSTRSNWR